MRDVRSVDGTGGIQDPKMNVSLMAKIGNASRAEIRKTLINDFNAFQSKRGTDAPNCSEFATQLNNWIKRPRAEYAVEAILRKICEQGMTTRPSYVKLLEEFKTPGPLTATEFRYGIQKIIP